MRASITTVVALDRFRPGIIAIESSSVNSTGHFVTVVRNTANGGPGESGDLAYTKSVLPGTARAATLASISMVPVTVARVVVLAVVFEVVLVVLRGAVAASCSASAIL